MYDLNYVSRKNIAGMRKDAARNCFSGKKLKVLTIPDGVIASGEYDGPGVFSGTDYIEESNFHYGFGTTKKLRLENPVISEEEVVFIGSFSGTWGHCITDNLKHLWILLDSGNLCCRLRFAYVMLNPEECLPESFLDMIEKLGKSRRELIRIDGVQQFRTVYVPEQCFFCVPGGDLFQSGIRYYTIEYKQMIQRIKEGIQPDTRADKIYFTRTELAHNNRDFGEKDIEETFRRAGYTVIAPEKITLWEQIAMLKGCEAFAATQGSVSLNAIFCEPKTEVFLIDKQNYLTPYQLAVNHARGGPVTVIDANRSVLNPKKTPWVGPFFMYNSKELCRWAGIPYPGFPLKAYMKYLKAGRIDKMSAAVFLNRVRNGMIRRMRNLYRKP